MRLRIGVALLLCLSLWPGQAAAQGEVKRFILAVGANFGGTDRPLLRYAVTDADRFVRVLTELGGVDASDVVMVKEPKAREFIQALDQLGARVREARRAGQGSRSEVLFYYSGHADDKGLLLGDDRLSYQSLRDRLEDISADVRIAILDACASGAFTRLKGGKVRKPFLVDESASMRGHAFLTSSSETEAAQESDRIGASYFTHFLVSGLRGAADVNGEGKITLNEAYQFAFNETLGKTAGSSGGAQHPSYEISLAGTGDVVMTDLHQPTSIMVLGEGLDGRVYIRNSRQELVAELNKLPGRRVEIAVEAGRYEVRVERSRNAFITTATLAIGQRAELVPNQFAVTTPDPTRRRGGFPLYAVAGRNRLELTLGMGPAASAGDPTTGVSAASATDVHAGLLYTKFLSERLAATLAITSGPGSSRVSVAPGGVSIGASSLLAVPVGFRWNPLSGDFRSRPIKPYLAASVGPVIGATAATRLGDGSVVIGARTAVTAGGRIGLGADVLAGRRWSFGVSGGYTWMADFSTPIGGRKNHSGFDVDVSFGWVWGQVR